MPVQTGELTFAEVAAVVGCTRQRAHQLEQSGLRKVVWEWWAMSIPFRRYVRRTYRPSAYRWIEEMRGEVALAVRAERQKGKG